MKKLSQHLGSDLPSGLVVFLVALPLCLGVALASNAPLFAGIIAGIVGGIIIGCLSGSSLSVSGPAAGLTAIVAVAIGKMPAYEAFVLSVVIAVVAGTAALWAGTRVRGIPSTIGASLIMGVAVSGMHYTGMAAMQVTPGPMPTMSGSTAFSFLVPLLLGVSLVTFVLTLTISLSPTEDEINQDAVLQNRIDTQFPAAQTTAAQTPAAQSSGTAQSPGTAQRSGPSGSLWSKPPRVG